HVAALTNEGLLREAVLNVVDNAVEHTSQGGVVVTARLTRGRGPGRRVRLDVTDTGTGIPPGQQGRGFERFFRGESPHLRGAGLGLAIAARAARAAGGELSLLRSGPGGTTFRFTFPGGTLLKQGAP